MKILHTADWHLGKLLKTASRLQDQRFVLEQIVQAIIAEKPDVMLLAGDIYDRSVPPSPAVELFDEYMFRIVQELETPVIAIAGNHDSAERIDCYSGLLRRQGLHINGIVRFPLQPVEICGVEFFPFPFVTPEQTRATTGVESISTHEDVFRYVVEHIESVRTSSKQAVLIAHLFASGAQNEGDEERGISVGGVETVSADVFTPFAYTALGHLHRPQALLQGRVRYSGSPVPYSFSEIGYEKTISVIDLHKDGSLEHRSIPLQQHREVRVVRGRIESEQGEKRFVVDSSEKVLPREHDFLKVELTNEILVMEPMQTIRRDFPNAIEMNYIKNTIKNNSASRTDASAAGMSRAGISTEELSALSSLQLCTDFVHAMSGENMSEAALNLLRQIVANIEQEREGVSESSKSAISSQSTNSSQEEVHA
jgi:exonuclease SbcD